MKNLSLVVMMFLVAGCGRSALFVSKGDPVVGPAGQNGHSAVLSQVSADSTVCPNGGSVLTGGVDLNDNGALDPSEVTTVAPACNGSPGPMGTAGVNGSNGTNATPITVVNLCPGVSNYDAFVEVGLCISGKLYGVYSSQGGFMTYLADGNYSSNAIGSACSLTVTGCTVTH